MVFLKTIFVNDNIGISNISDVFYRHPMYHSLYFDKYARVGHNKFSIMISS